MSETTAAPHPAALASLERFSGWLAAALEAERERWALWFPVGFGAGVGIYFALAQEPALWLGPAGVVLTGLAAAVLRGRPASLMLSLALATIAAGFAAAQLRSAQVAAPVLERRLGPMPVEGQVLVVEPRTSGWRLTLRNPRISGVSADSTPAKIRVSGFGSLKAVRPGDRVRLRAVLRPPPEPAAPGAFDFARQAFFAGLGAVGYARGGVTKLGSGTTISDDARATIPGLSPLWWSRLRHHIAERILAVLPGPRGAVAVALMTGERGAIPKSTLQAMRDSGLAHLLAISGLHVGLVAGLLFFGLRALLALVPALALNHPIKKWAALVAACGAFAYLLLTGATVPTQRAFFMVGLMLLAVILDRAAFSFRLIAWAAIAVLAVAPESLLTPSFQLSFAAVTALIAAYELLRERRRTLFAERGPMAKLGLYLGGVGVTSLVAGLATAPFAIYHFNRIAWFGLAGNFMAVPLTALWIMPWAIGAYLLMPFGAEALALVPMGWGIAALLAIAERVASWPGAVSVVPAMPTTGLVMIALGGAWLCLWRRPWRLIGLLPIVAGLMTVPLTKTPDVLVSGDAKLMAVRGSDGALLVSSARTRRFDADIWRRRLGMSEIKAWPRQGEAADGRLRCDPLGCLYRVNGRVIALALDGRALQDDCVVAAVTISREPARGRCRGPQRVIDRFTLWRHGGHALWLDEEEIRIETVRARRGARPWVRQRGAGRSSRDGLKHLKP